MNWELSAAPYLPIHRKRTRRRRFIAGAVIGLVLAPVAAYRHYLISEPIGARVFNDVAASVGVAYYDPTFRGRAWPDIARTFRASIEDAPDAATRYGALRSMLSALGDSHTRAFSPLEVARAEHRSDAGVTGALLGSVGGKPVVIAVAPHSPAQRSGFHRGDIVASADYRAGRPGDVRLFSLRNPLTGRTRSVALRLAPALAIEEPGGPEIDWNVVAPHVGYLRIASFPDAIGDVLGWAMQELQDQPALILDLRSNPGGMLDAVDATAGIFLPQGSLVVQGWRRMSWFGPQRFTADGSVGYRYRGKLIVLVDETSESGAETLAAALQAYGRARLVGTRTAGRVMGVGLEEPLPDGGLLRVATLDMRTPRGVRLEGRGVTPDVIVRRTAADVALGRDPQLRAAVKIAENRSSAGAL